MTAHIVEYSKDSSDGFNILLSSPRSNNDRQAKIEIQSLLADRVRRSLALQKLNKPLEGGVLDIMIELFHRESDGDEE